MGYEPFKHKKKSLLSVDSRGLIAFKFGKTNDYVKVDSEEDLEERGRKFDDRLQLF